MEENKQNTLKRAYVTLTSFRKNIDTIKENRIRVTYVQKFHAVLSRLEGIGIDISEFRIPDSEVEPRITSSWRDDSGFHHRYSEEKYVQRSFILTELDAILGYFEIIISDEPRRIGFHTPENK